MQDALAITTTIAFLLLLGLLASWTARKLRIPDGLLLLIIGIVAARISYKQIPLIQFPEVFLHSLAILGLTMVAFDSAARLRFRELDTSHRNAARLAFANALFMLVFFTAAAKYLLGESWLNSLLMAALLIGTSAEHGLPRLESMISTPLAVVLPFIALSLIQLGATLPFALNIVIGIGTGIFAGVILFKLIQHSHEKTYSPLVLILAGLLSYVLAERLGGSGVLAAGALGLFLGNVYAKQKITLLDGRLGNALTILAFILAGLLVDIPYSIAFFITSGILFAAYIALRFIAALISMKQGIHEMVYMTLNAPKGSATAVVLFALLAYPIEGLNTILSTAFAIMAYSLILSFITNLAVRHENSTR